MDLKEKNASGEASQQSESTPAASKTNEFVIEKERSFEEEEEVETYGVYYNGSKERSLLGLFWDEKMAKLFVEAVKSSEIYNEIKSVD